MASRWFPEGQFSVRPRTAWVFLLAALVVTVPVFVAALFPVRPATPAITVTAVVATVMAYIYFVSPRILVDDDAITVQNAWREHTVPWGALISVDTQFNLTLVTPQGAVHAQAAPSPGGLSALRARPDKDPATARALARGAGSVRAGDLPSSVSGSLATVIRGHWQDLVETGAIDTTQRMTTRLRSAHLTITLAGVVLVMASWLMA